MIGKTITHYKILEKLGSGGMGVVYKAEDNYLKRTVALKVLPAHISSDEVEKNRFIHEARTASSLDHPNICTIHEIGGTEDGLLFIAMAYYRGETLKKKIENGPLKIEEAIDIAIQVTQGLTRAHEAEVVHRDVKSGNIMITQKNQVKIMDFGLAKSLGRTTLTIEGTTLGTVNYISPEQAAGDKIDIRTDIWSLGVVLYEMLAGVLPFKGEYEQAVINSIINEKYEQITSLRSGVPIEIDHILDKALAKKADERYQHMDEILVDLRKVKNRNAKKSKETENIYSSPKKNKKEFERKLCAIMFTDVVGYTAIMGDNEARASEVLRQQKSVVATKTEEHKGLVLKEIGDGNLCSFSSSVEAVNCAVDIQNVLKGKDFKIRIGIHVGDVVFDGEEIYGDGVNISSRIEGLAQAGCICISRTVYEQVRNQEHIKIKRLGEKTLKNVSAPVEIYEILVDSAGEKKQLPKKSTRFYVTLITSLLFLVAALFLYLQWNERQPIVSDSGNERDLVDTRKPEVIVPDAQKSANLARQGMVTVKNDAHSAKASGLSTFSAAIKKEEEAEQKFYNGDFQGASLSFDMARDLFQKAQGDKRLETEATIAMNEMDNAKTEAESVTANTNAKDSFAVANQKEKEAHDLFSQERFQEATVAFGEAHQSYVSADTEARTSLEKNAEEARTLRSELDKLKAELPENPQFLAEYKQAKEAESKGDAQLTRREFSEAIRSYRQVFQHYERAIAARQDQIKQIQSVIAEYESALKNRDIEQLSNLYANFTNERKQWIQVFDNVEKVEAQMVIDHYNFQEGMVTILVDTRLTYIGFSNSDNQFRWKIRFVGTNGEWLISGISTVN